MENGMNCWKAKLLSLATSQSAAKPGEVHKGTQEGSETNDCGEHPIRSTRASRTLTRFEKGDDIVRFCVPPTEVGGIYESRSGRVKYLPVTKCAITKRQGIQMIEKKFNLGSTNIVTAINAFTGGKLFRAYIDGQNVAAAA